MEKIKAAQLLDTRPRVRFFAQAGVGTAFTCLTSGVFLSGLALSMGAGDVLLSYLSIILNICGVVIVAFGGFLERFASRKRLTLALTVLSRLATLLLVAIPALVPPRLRLVLFVPAVVLAFTLQAQTTVVLNQWMLCFVDPAKSGRYISLRQTLTLAVTVALSLAGGWWMDRTGQGYGGFVALFAVAGLMGAAEVALLARTPDGPARPRQQVCRLRDLLGLPLRDRPFARFVAYIFGFYLFLNIADSFTMVFLMKYLALPYQTVTALYMIVSLPQVLLLVLWGRLSDRKGHGFALRASIWLFIGEVSFMAFAAPGTWFVFVPLAFLTASVANAGFTVAVFNRRYELMPTENRIVYDNFFTAAVGLGVILGPALGGLFKAGLEALPQLTQAVPLGSIRLLYPISALGIAVLQLVFLRLHRQSAKETPSAVGEFQVKTDCP